MAERATTSKEVPTREISSKFYNLFFNSKQTPLSKSLENLRNFSQLNVTTANEAQLKSIEDSFKTLKEELEYVNQTDDDILLVSILIDTLILPCYGFYSTHKIFSSAFFQIFNRLFAHSSVLENANYYFSITAIISRSKLYAPIPIITSETYQTISNPVTYPVDIAEQYAGFLENARNKKSRKNDGELTSLEDLLIQLCREDFIKEALINDNRCLSLILSFALKRHRIVKIDVIDRTKTQEDGLLKSMENQFVNQFKYKPSRINNNNNNHHTNTIISVDCRVQWTDECEFTYRNNDIHARPTFLTSLATLLLHASIQFDNSEKRSQWNFLLEKIQQTTLDYFSSSSRFAEDDVKEFFLFMFNHDDIAIRKMSTKLICSLIDDLELSEEVLLTPVVTSKIITSLIETRITKHTFEIDSILLNTCLKVSLKWDIDDVCHLLSMLALRLNKNDVHLREDIPISTNSQSIQDQTCSYSTYLVERENFRSNSKINFCLINRVDFQNLIADLEKSFIDEDSSKDDDSSLNQIEQSIDQWPLDIQSLIPKRETFPKLVQTKTMLLNRKRILECIRTPIHLLLQGATGVGKTSLIFDVAADLKRPLIRFNLSSKTDVAALFGSFKFQKKNSIELDFEEGPFTYAYCHGLWLLLDEMNLAPPNVLQAMEQAIESGVLILPNVENEDETQTEVNYRTYKMHSEFRLFATQNPSIGQYKGARDQQSAALLSRFSIFIVDAPEPTELVDIIQSRLTLQKVLFTDLTNSMVKLHENLMNLVKNANFPENNRNYGEITIRELFRWCQSLCNYEKMFTNTPQSVEKLSAKEIDSIVIEQAFIMYGARFRQQMSQEKIANEIKEVFRTNPIFDRVLTMDFEIRDKIGFRLNQRLLLQISTISLKRIREEWPRQLSEPHRMEELERIVRIHNFAFRTLHEEDKLQQIYDCSYTLLCSLCRNQTQRNKIIDHIIREYSNSDIDIKGSIPSLSSARPAFYLDVEACRIVQYILSSSPTQPILIVGPEGSGKSHLVRSIATVAQVRCRHLYITPQTEPSALVGSIVPHPEFPEWQDGAVSEAAEKGYWLILENFSEASSAVLERLNSVLEQPAQWIKVENNETKSMKISPHFRIIATMSPPSERLQNASIETNHELSPALYNRFLILYYSGLSVTSIETYRNLFRSYFPIEDEPLINYLHNQLKSESITIRHIVQWFDCTFQLQHSTYMKDLQPNIYSMLLAGLELVFPKDTKISTNIQIYLREKAQPVVINFFDVFVTPEQRKEHREHIIDPIQTRARYEAAKRPAATGKTSLVEYVAHCQNKRLYRVNNTKGTTVQDYFGSYMPNGEFLPGSLSCAMSEGHWFVADEFDLAEPAVMNVLYPILEGQKHLTVPNTGRILLAKDGFRFFATQNGTTYIGRKQLPKTLRSRFLEIFFENFSQDELTFIIMQRKLPGSQRLNLDLEKFAPRIASTITIVNQSIENKFPGLLGAPKLILTMREVIKWIGRKQKKPDVSWEEHALRLLESRVPKQYYQDFLVCLKDQHALPGLIDAPIQIRIDEKQISLFRSPDLTISYDFTNRNAVEQLQLSSAPKSFLLALWRIFAAVEQHEPVLLLGPTCYKSHLIKVWAKLTNKQSNLCTLTCSTSTETNDLIGSIRPYTLADALNLLVSSLSQFHNRVNSCDYLISQSNHKDLDRFRELYIEPLERDTNKFIEALKEQTNRTRSKRATLQQPISETIPSNLLFTSIDDDVLSDLVHVISPRSLTPPISSFYRSIKDNDDEIDRIESIAEINDIVRNQQNQKKSSNPFAADDDDDDNQNTKRASTSQLTTTTVQPKKIHDPFAADDDNDVDENAKNVSIPQFTTTTTVKRKKIHDPFAADDDDDDGIIQPNAPIVKPTAIVSVIREKVKDPFAADDDDDDDDQEPVRNQIPMSREDQLLTFVHATQMFSDLSRSTSTSSLNIPIDVNPISEAFKLIDETLQRTIKQLSHLCGLVQYENGVNLIKIRCETIIKEIRKAIQDGKTNIFLFQDGPVTSAVKEGQILVLEDINEPSQAVIERLNSLFETEPSFTLYEDFISGDSINDNNAHRSKIPILPSFQVFATVHIDERTEHRLQLSAATRSRMTEIRVQPYNYTEMKELAKKIETNTGDKAKFDEKIEILAQELSPIISQTMIIDELNSRHFIQFAECLHLHRQSMPIEEAAALCAKFLFLDNVTQTQKSIISKLQSANVAWEKVRTAFKCSYDCMKFDEQFEELGVYTELNQWCQEDEIILHPRTSNERKHLVLRLKFNKLIAPFAPQPKPLSKDYKFPLAVTKSVLNNISRILFSLHSSKRQLLIGPPGVGKTRIIEVLAEMLGYNVVRINFSSNTTFEDLIGSFVPRVVHGQRSFEFQEGPLYMALTKNLENTVLLFDELNLASKDLLNQLTPLFANEEEFFIPALAKRIPIKGSIVVAAMNPTSTGGGREKLPRSTQTHFLQVHLAPFEIQEFEQITKTLLYPHLVAGYLTSKLIKNINIFHYEINEKARLRQIGRIGGPYDFNLRDIEKLSNLIGALSVIHRAHMNLAEQTNSSSMTTSLIDDNNDNDVDSLNRIEEQNLIRSLHVYLDIVYASRFENIQDQELVRDLIRQRFPLDNTIYHHNRQTMIDTDLNLQGYVRLGFVYVEKKEYPSYYRACVHSQRTLEKLQLLAAATVSKATVLIEGDDCAGKTAIICELARVCGRRLLVLNLNHETTTSDLLGSWTVINKQSYEQRRKQNSQQFLNDVVRFTLTTLIPMTQKSQDAETLIRNMRSILCHWESDNLEETQHAYEQCQLILETGLEHSKQTQEKSISDEIEKYLDTLDQIEDDCKLAKRLSEGLTFTFNKGPLIQIISIVHVVMLLNV
ncbi:hypothetical protein I4U23_013709 [Adineta vaga]|nr:hypothetical protein I4U23_013709 [Adineta vaga]